MPLLKSNQNKYFDLKNLKLKNKKSKFLIKNGRYHRHREGNNNANNRHSSTSFEYNTNSYQSNNVHLNTSLENSPFVSVIIPARNEEKYIERCLLSLLSQDYPNFEIIALDDNSTDNTLTIMEDMKRNDMHWKMKGFPNDKLKITSLKYTPDKWTGKTWASEQGYLQSRGTILLFADADTNYISTDLIRQAVFYMQNENLDVLTGIPSDEKPNSFWSKIILPVWGFVNILFKVGSAEVNNSKSNIAYLMGSFLLIKRETFINIGTFESVSDAIQEDKALGVLIKKRGYNIKIVALKGMANTPSSEGVKTIWHLLGRTLAPLTMKNKFKVIFSLLVIFFVCSLSFVIFVFALLFIIGVKSSFVSISEITFHFYPYVPLLSLIPFMMALIGCSIKCKEYGITPLYSLASPFTSIFIIIACLYNIAPLLIVGKTKPIVWQGRQYSYSKEKDGFHI